MAKVQDFTGLVETLKRLKDKAAREGNPSVVVGYSAGYALYVHEAVGMKLKGLPRQPPGKGLYWDPQGRAQAKFLEQPARELSNDGTLGKIVQAAVLKGATLGEALSAAGERLQAASQKLVPVDTGNLKGSAFTELEK